MVAIEDLRTASEKMIQLKYTKQELDVYKDLHNNDSILIYNLDNKLNQQYKQQSKIKKQRNILGVVSTVLLGVILGLL